MNAPLYDLIEPSREFFAKRRLIIAGTVFDERILKLAADTQKTDIIVDNYNTAGRLAAMTGNSFTHDAEQSFSYKHLSVHFCSVERALEKISEADCLLILIDKSKSQNLKALRLLSTKLCKGALIFTAGANDEGGRSADTLLKEFGSPRKMGIKRKCTLFGVEFEHEGSPYSPLPPIEYTVKGTQMQLLQDEAVFSKGRIDEGSAMLLDALSKAHIKAKEALDLGCGCGVIGIYLQKLGVERVLSTDVSATALQLTQKNAALNDISLQTSCANMLQDLGSFDLIAVNPPFHQGSSVERQAALNMIREAPDHLNEGGFMMLVGNSFLGYEEPLKQNFENVKCMQKTTRFCVYKAW